MKIIKIFTIFVTLTLVACSQGKGSNSLLKAAAASAPDVSMESVDIAKLSATSQTFNFKVKVTNPNSIPLPIKTLQYKVALNEVDMAEDSTQINKTIPAHGSELIEIPITTNLLKSIPSLAMKVISSPSQLQYSLQGKVEAGNNLLALPVPLNFSGTIPLARIPLK